MKKPVVNAAQPNKNLPVAGGTLPKNEWLFSFKEFGQIINFGLSNRDFTWFASLFSRLRDLSKINLDILFKNVSLRDELRYHPIDWNARGIPIQRSDLTWVNKDVVSNEEEFIFYQFHISKALGRVIGYWQENVFYIVLLDPMHNMQPSNYNEYKIRASTPVETDISSFLYELEKIKNIDCGLHDCVIKKSSDAN